jgi:hypothetical protein
MAETLPEQGQRLIWKEVGVLSDAKCRKDRDGSCVVILFYNFGHPILVVTAGKGGVCHKA